MVEKIWAQAKEEWTSIGENMVKEAELKKRARRVKRIQKAQQKGGR